MPDLIRLKKMQVPAFIGVPDEERVLAQSLTLNVDLEPARSLAGLDDKIEATINYAEVDQLIRQIAAERPRRLLETLGDDLARGLFENFPVASLRIEIEKQILPGMDAVSLDRGFRRDDH